MNFAYRVFFQVPKFSVICFADESTLQIVSGWKCYCLVIRCAGKTAFTSHLPIILPVFFNNKLVALLDHDIAHKKTSVSLRIFFLNPAHALILKKIPNSYRCLVMFHKYMNRPIKSCTFILKPMFIWQVKIPVSPRLVCLCSAVHSKCAF